MRLIALLVLLVSTGSSQSLEVTPRRVASDENAVIRATGLDPNERVTIRAELADGANHAWNSQAEFTADSSGVVDVSKLAPVAGSYKMVSSMGLIWSMKPADKGTAMYQLGRNLPPQVTHLVLVRKGHEAAKAELEQDFVAEGVQRAPVHDGDLRGMLFVPAGKDRHPGIVVVPGSNGGAPVMQAAWLASHGYAALALAYFRYEDLPQRLEGIPLEYFQRAFQWMASRPEIQPERLAVLGTSRGGELALLLGSMFPAIHAVVAYVPSNVLRPACCGGNTVPYAWTWRGEPLAYLPIGNPLQGEMALRATIQVERTKGPILMISGEQDGVWRSSMMADLVLARLKSAHFTYDAQNLKYPHAGHSAGRPDISPAWHEGVRQPLSGRIMDLGGTPQGDAESSIDSMPKVLEFLKRTLVDH
jgi:dienelactone hydrolase